MIDWLRLQMTDVIEYVLDHDAVTTGWLHWWFDFHPVTMSACHRCHCHPATTTTNTVAMLRAFADTLDRLNEDQQTGWGTEYFPLINKACYQVEKLQDCGHHRKVLKQFQVLCRYGQRYCMANGPKPALEEHHILDVHGGSCYHAGTFEDEMASFSLRRIRTLLEEMEDAKALIVTNLESGHSPVSGHHGLFHANDEVWSMTKQVHRLLEITIYMLRGYLQGCNAPYISPLSQNQKWRAWYKTKWNRDERKRMSPPRKCCLVNGTVHVKFNGLVINEMRLSS